MILWEKSLKLELMGCIEEGLRVVIKWSENEKAEDNFEKATKELREKGLI